MHDINLLEEIFRRNFSLKKKWKAIKASTATSIRSGSQTTVSKTKTKGNRAINKTFEL